MLFNALKLKLITYKKLHNTNVVYNYATFIDEQSTIEEFSNINGARLINCHVGMYTYLGKTSTISNVFFGRFCSVAAGLKIVFGRHPTNGFVSTSPLFYSLNPPIYKAVVKKQKFNEFSYVSNENKHMVIIENDVWIGLDVKIMEGVTISNGAIIAAGSVVTKDIPPYEIWGGVPAKKIKDRFSIQDKEFLVKSRWWENDHQWFIDNADSFEDIESLKKVIL